jgi:hypothetical protein
VNIDAKFQGPRVNDSAVLRGQADACASLRGVHGAAQKHRTDTDGRSNLVKDLALKHCVCLSSAVGRYFPGESMSFGFPADCGVEGGLARSVVRNGTGKPPARITISLDKVVT